MTRDPARRTEWLLMYRQGLEAEDIARICHTLPHVAAAFIAEQVTADPGLFDRRLCRCLQPSLPVFRDEGAVDGWDGNRLSLFRFVQSRRRFPHRSADTTTTSEALEVFLYHWVRAQRAAAAEGRLTGRQERQLEATPDGPCSGTTSSTPGTGMNGYRRARGSLKPTDGCRATAMARQHWNVLWALG